mgnify:CR=1 FL=1
MKYLIILLLCLGICGCEETKKERVVAKPIFLKGEAYIYYYENYKGLEKYWYWIYLAEESGWDEDNRRPIAKILQKGDAFTLVEFYSTPCPLGVMVEIIIPNELIYYYGLNNAIISKIESKKNEKYEKHFETTSDSLKQDIRKTNQQGEFVDTYFGLIKTGRKEAL